MRLSAPFHDPEFSQPDLPEANLMAAVVSRSIKDYHEHIKNRVLETGRLRKHLQAKQDEYTEILIEWAFDEVPRPVNLVWIAEHISHGESVPFIKAVRFAMLNPGFDHRSRAFSYRRTYKKEQAA